MKSNNKLVSGLKKNGPYTSNGYGSKGVDTYGKPVKTGSYSK